MRPASHFLLGLVLPAAVACFCAPSVAIGEGAYRSAASAPASWQAFAKQLQSRFEARLSADDENGHAFQDHVAKRAGTSDASPLTFVARAWILPDGEVERLEFDGLDDKAMSDSLRMMLTHENVGAPPPEMLQPVRLRLSLRLKDQPAGD